MKKKLLSLALATILTAGLVQDAEAVHLHPTRAAARTTHRKRLLR